MSQTDKGPMQVYFSRYLQDIWVSWMLVCHGLLCGYCDRGHRNEWYRNSEKELASNSIDICIAHTQRREWSRSTETERSALKSRNYILCAKVFQNMGS